MKSTNAILAICALLLSPALAASAEPAGKPPAPVKQRTFDTPRAAADALIAAAGDWDVATLKAILGPSGVDLVVTEDSVQDRNQGAAFAALAVRPGLITMIGLVSATSRAADRNERASPMVSM